MAKCNAECEVYSRVCGYHRPVKNWNKGKQEEFKQRKLYKAELPSRHECRYGTSPANENAHYES